jgi:hypothetical protein
VPNVTFGIKTLFLLFSALVFIIAVFDEDDYANLLAWGLSGIALALLLTDIGWDRKYGGGMRRRPNP